MRAFCTFGADSCAQSVLINKLSASELSRKFIKGALLVGCSDNFQKKKSCLQVLLAKEERGKDAVNYRQESRFAFSLGKGTGKADMGKKLSLGKRGGG